MLFVFFQNSNKKSCQSCKIISIPIQFHKIFDPIVLVQAITKLPLFLHEKFHEWFTCFFFQLFQLDIPTKFSSQKSMNLLWKCEIGKKSTGIKTDIQVTIFPISKERRPLFVTKSCFLDISKLYIENLKGEFKYWFLRPIG